jgi:hexosaminidase
MKITLTVLFAGCLVCAVAQPLPPPSIIPVSEEMTVQPGAFHLRVNPQVVINNNGSEPTAKFLAARLRAGTGYKVKITSPLKTSGPGNIWLCLTNNSAALGAEGYELRTEPDAVVITAQTQAGLFYGVQTLLQLLPPEILASSPASRQDWVTPCVHIVDKPRFPWRGLMLDVSRHFFTTSEVEKVMDAMALYKLNTFHFHLVDDVGWRIEIKKYPRLTQIAAWRKGIDFGLDAKSSTAYRPDEEYGGFYTQKDIRELVAYAAARHITVVPEIEMPGHSAGALAPYPQYSCFGGPFNNDGDQAVFCPGNEETYTFLENILTEVFEMFPSQFVHIGGDEVSTADWKRCPKCQALMKEQGLHQEIQLEGYLIQRIEKFANAHGKRLIGWSEIRKAGLAKNAAVMDWIGGAAEAAEAGHDVVLSPASPDFAYLDHYQSTNHTTEPRAIGGFLPLRNVYQFEPIPKNLPAEFQSHVLGGQGNLWTEYVPNIKHAEYMIFPRECAMAEVLWSPKASRDWDGFLARIKFNERRLEEMGVNFRRNPAATDAHPL